MTSISLSDNVLASGVLHTQAKTRAEAMPANQGQGVIPPVTGADMFRSRGRRPEVVHAPYIEAARASVNRVPCLNQCSSLTHW